MTLVNKTYHPFANQTATNLADFLEQFVGDVEKHYNWNFDAKGASDLLGYDFLQLPNVYQKTIKFKEMMVEKMNQCASYEERFILGEYYVVQWGGVSSNKNLKETLQRYDKVDDLSSITTLDGASSWSKYLSLRNAEAAIYDSRVAYAINVINFLKGHTDCFFKIPLGRSPRLNLINIETFFVVDRFKRDPGFIPDDEVDHRQFASKTKQKFHLLESATYSTYLDVLKRTAQKLNLSEDERHKVEMLLFALAPTEVLRALISVQYNNAK